MSLILTVIVLSRFFGCSLANGLRIGGPSSGQDVQRISLRRHGVKIAAAALSSAVRDLHSKLLIGISFAGLIFGVKTAFAADRIIPSPDKQWEYRCSEDGWTVGIVKAGTSETVLKLSLDGGDKAVEVSSVVWAPDSKRFAFNHWDGYKASGTSFYQLQDGKWTTLNSPDDEIEPIFGHALSAAKAKKHLSKSAQERDVGEYLKVTQWTGNDTLILRAVETYETGGNFLALGFLFTVKFDGEGNWRIVETHQMSETEAKKE
jgi:hypothetical protein